MAPSIVERMVMVASPFLPTDDWWCLPDLLCTYEEIYAERGIAVIRPSLKTVFAPTAYLFLVHPVSSLASCSRYISN